MPIFEMQDDVELIQQLGDRPNTDNELSAQQLKELFDKAPSLIKAFINGTLVPEVNRLGSDAYIEKVANEAVRGLVEQDIPITVDLEGAEPITPNVDVDSLTKPGRYACETDEIAKTLLGCDVDKAFTMDVRYSDGVGPHIGQELRPSDAGARLYRQLAGFSDALGEAWTDDPNGYPVPTGIKSMYDRLRGEKPQGSTYNGDVSTYWYEHYVQFGNNVFTIETADDLYGFAKLVNEDGVTFEGYTVKLGADIIINDGDASDWDTYAPTHKWTPIGGLDSSWNTCFKGTFDGQNHYISGIYCVNAMRSQLITQVQDATIKNLAVVNSYFENTELNDTNNGQLLATFVGQGRGVHLENLYSDAILVGGTQQIGGIASYVQGAEYTNPRACKVDSCVFAGSINGGTVQNVGGIVGSDNNANGHTVISNCLNLGDITSDGNRVGGIIGKGQTHLSVTHCVSVGTVSCGNTTYDSVALVGHAAANTEVNNCYYLTGNKEYGGGKEPICDNIATIAENLRHSIAPTKWAKVYDSENKPTLGELGAMAMEVLWTNANPGGYFPAQTLQLDLTPYDYVAVIAGETSGSSPSYMPMVVVPCAVGSYGSISGHGFDINTSEVWMFFRRFKVATNGLEFGSGNQYRLPNLTMYAAWENKAVPMAILGIKGVVK